MNNPTQLLPTDLIAVEVPKDANYSIHNNRLEFISQEKGIGCIFLSQTTKDKFHSLGKVTADEITFDGEPYLIKIKNPVLLSLHYFDYKKSSGIDSFVFKTAKESFYSLLQSNGLYFVNPIEKPIDNSYLGGRGNVDAMKLLQYEDKLAKWQEAESKVIKGKLVILKKL